MSQDAFQPRPIVDAASRRVAIQVQPDCGYFDPEEPIGNLNGNLPHLRQAGVTYFVTFRTVDSLPQSKLELWIRERDEWCQRNPQPHSIQQRRDFFERFTLRLQKWLDAGYGECLLAQPTNRRIVVEALDCFVGTRYHLRAWVVMPNHVHAIITPHLGHELSDILHSWKSFTSKAINKLLNRKGSVWQKESFDHIVRGPDSLERIEMYIRNNPRGLSKDSYTVSEQFI